MDKIFRFKLCAFLFGIRMCVEFTAGTSCTQDTSPVDCVACEGENIDVACSEDQLVVIDDVVASYSSSGTIGYGESGCEMPADCSSTSAAVSQIKQCTWQHSSCRISVSAWTMSSECDFLYQLIRANITFHCEPNIMVLNFGRTLQQTIVFSDPGDNIYLLSPCHPRHYSDCPYYELNTPAVINVTNMVPSRVIQMTKIAMQSCELQISTPGGIVYTSVCSELGLSNSTVITESSFEAQFLGARPQQSGFLIHISLIEYQPQATRPETSTEGISTSLEFLTDPTSDPKSATTVIAIATSVVLISIIIGAITTTFIVILCQKRDKKSLQESPQNKYYVDSAGDKVDGFQA